MSSNTVKMVRLDTLAKRGSGHTPRKSVDAYWNGSIPWVSLQDSANLDRPFIFETAVSITELGIKNSSACIHPAGTVVLSRDAGVGKSTIIAVDMAVSQHFIAWTCGPNLNNIFLYYYLQSRKSEFERIAIGSTIKTIGLPYFIDYCIPFFPLVEQEAIAEALSDADALIEGLERLIAKKRLIKQGAMQDLLTAKRRLPGFSGEWGKRPLSELGRCIRGVSYNGQQDLFPIQNLNTATLLRSNNVRDGALNYENVQYVNIMKVSPDQIMRSGDVLICMANGSRSLVGKSATFRGKMEDLYTFGAFMGVFRTTEADVSSRYISWALSSDKFKCHVSNTLSGSAINNLTPSQVGSCVIDIPLDVVEQREIALVIDDMDAEIQALEIRLNKARQVKEGMMQNLLTGRVRLV